MPKNNENNGNKKKVYIRPEDALEFVYEVVDKYKDADSAPKAIENLKRDMRRMIRYFKHDKFDKLQGEFGVDP